METKLVPEENVEIFCYLYGIEVALRELIITTLESLDGPHWYKKRLPADILEKYRNGRNLEKNIKWTRTIPHHPIYYIDFTDLKKIIERQDNWDDVFKPIFLRKDILSSSLSEIEIIRNKIAHNRKATQKDVAVIKGTYTKLSETIGEKRFSELTLTCSCAMDISQLLGELRQEAEHLFHNCKNYKPVEKITIWNLVKNKWWFDESYLGNKVDGITDYFQTVEKYATLPRIRGSGHKIELWVADNSIDAKYNRAKSEFAAMLTRQV